MITLPINNEFTKIIHISDIHIRLQKRHDEFKEVFDVFFDKISKYSSDDTCIVFTGDLFHSKTDLQPECIQLASYFITKCGDMFPTIIIAGNHDMLIANKNRLDSITPIIDALNHSNVFYLKTTGLYGFGNILWNNMCVFDSVDRYIDGKTIPAVYRNQYKHIIALFHGAVDKAALDTGYTISNPSIMTPLFDYNDIALLGDIHKKQDMQEYCPDENKPCIHYVGSLICQNHGESLTGHGYSLWDLSTRTYTHHEIPNDYGYFTIDVDRGILNTDISDIPKKVRLRIRCYNSISSEIKAIIAKIKTVSDVIETSYLRMDQEQDTSNIIKISDNIILSDLTNTEYQSELITNFLFKKNRTTSQSKIESILNINKTTNTLIKQDDFARNLKWKLIRFEWDNMFTYGEGNVIDFSQLSGTYGIFGPNKTGKCVDKNTNIDIEYNKEDIIKKLGFLPDELK